MEHTFPASVGSLQVTVDMKYRRLPTYECKVKRPLKVAPPSALRKQPTRLRENSLRGEGKTADEVEGKHREKLYSDFWSPVCKLYFAWVGIREARSLSLPLSTFAFKCKWTRQEWRMQKCEISKWVGEKRRLSVAFLNCPYVVYKGFC